MAESRRSVLTLLLLCAGLAVLALMAFLPLVLCPWHPRTMDHPFTCRTCKNSGRVSGLKSFLLNRDFRTWEGKEIQSIFAKGLEKQPQGKMLAISGLKMGAVANRKLLFDASQELMKTDAFREVDIEAEELKPGSALVRVTVNVEEK